MDGPKPPDPSIEELVERVRSLASEAERLRDALRESIAKRRSRGPAVWVDDRAFERVRDETLSW